MYVPENITLQQLMTTFFIQGRNISNNDNKEEEEEAKRKLPSLLLREKITRLHAIISSDKNNNEQPQWCDGTQPPPAMGHHYPQQEQDHRIPPCNIVRHCYEDHANDVYDESMEPTTPKAGPSTPFPIRLHRMLEQVNKDRTVANVVSWQPHGRCFVVHDNNAFVKYIMPKYFRQSKFPSFQRQLNLYGFRRITKGPDRGGYYHELFLRGKPNLTKKIQRMRVKGTGVRPRSNPSKEPNFYAMVPLGQQEGTPFPVPSSSPVAAIEAATTMTTTTMTTTTTTMTTMDPYPFEEERKDSQVMPDSKLPSQPSEKKSETKEPLHSTSEVTVMPLRIAPSSYEPPLDQEAEAARKNSPTSSTGDMAEDEEIDFAGRTFHYVTPGEIVRRDSFDQAMFLGKLGISESLYEDMMECTKDDYTFGLFIENDLL